MDLNGIPMAEITNSSARPTVVPAQPLDPSTPDAIDRAMMARCVELSRIGAGAGELPFGSLVAQRGKILAEATNRAVRDGDISRHAEIIAIAQAQKVLGTRDLADCTLYSTVEPCPMCSFCIRESGIGRVVFALSSPVMGGFSKWNILRDDGLTDDIPLAFGAVPEVVTGILPDEAAEAWRAWNPLAWRIIRLRGYLTDPTESAPRVHPARPRRPLWRMMRTLFAR